MGMIRRLAVLGAAAAGAAWFLKQRQEQSEPAWSGASASGGGTSATSGDATNGQVSETDLSERAEDVGDSAAAGTGTAPEPTAQQETKISETVEPPRDTVEPDTSGDALVREQENAAASEAGAIGGEPETPQSQEGPADDPAMKPVVEASGEEPETLEATDDDLGAGRERQS